MTSQRYANIVPQAHGSFQETSQWFRACKEVSLTCFILGLISGGIFGGTITNFFIIPIQDQTGNTKISVPLSGTPVIPAPLETTTALTTRTTKQKTTKARTTQRKTTTTTTTTTTRPTTTKPTTTSTTVTTTTTLPKTTRARWDPPFDKTWKSCEDVYKSGYKNSSVYRVNVMEKTIHVFCNMENGGGWTLFQRREDGSVKFNRNWTEYEKGFGEKYGEFWLGNSWLSAMTTRKKLLRVQLRKFDGEYGYAEYSDFKVGNKKTNYTLSIGWANKKSKTFSPFKFQQNYNKKRFHTTDNWKEMCKENKKPIKCTDMYGNGGWWFHEYNQFNLNGKYTTKYNKENNRNVFWLSFNNMKPLKTTELMFRSQNFKG